MCDYNEVLVLSAGIIGWSYRRCVHSSIWIKIFPCRKKFCVL